MRATVKATDNLTKKSIEFNVNINLSGDVAREFNDICRQKKGREQIIKGLKLYMGDARLELIVSGNVIAEGTISYDAFSGHGDVQTKLCQPRQAA